MIVQGEQGVGLLLVILKRGGRGHRGRRAPPHARPRRLLRRDRAAEHRTRFAPPTPSPPRGSWRWPARRLLWQFRQLVACRSRRWPSSVGAAGARRCRAAGAGALRRSRGGHALVADGGGGRAGCASRPVTAARNRSRSSARRTTPSRARTVAVRGMSRSRAIWPNPSAGTSVRTGLPSTNTSSVPWPRGRTGRRTRPAPSPRSRRPGAPPRDRARAARWWPPAKGQRWRRAQQPVLAPRYGARPRRREARAAEQRRRRASARR